MQRRIALKNIATAAGMMMLPAWANGWSKKDVTSAQPYLSLNQDQLLAEIVETIIPATDTPGAKALHVHNFVQKMIADCHEEEVQKNLVKGLNAVESLAKQQFGTSFDSSNTTQRIEVLTRMEQSDDADQKAFYLLVKDLTIQGYMTSEYVMTKHTNYTMVPGHYYGCVPVSTK